MKKNRKREEFLEQLRRIPIVQVCCEKIDISRNTVYRWKKDDPTFRAAMEEALAEGEALVNDMSESQLLSLIKDKNWPAISFWLRHRNPRFKEKIEVTTRSDDNEALTPAQVAVVRKALELGTILPTNTNSDETNNDPTGSRRPNDEGSKNSSSHN